MEVGAWEGMGIVAGLIMGITVEYRWEREWE
jgi:hypothetical protein